MPQYNVGVILNPSLEPTQLNNEKEVIEHALAGVEAQIGTVDEWGNRRLAYPIEKEFEGYYIFYSVQMEAKHAKLLEHELRVRDNVRRVLVVRERSEWKQEKA